MGRCGVPDDLAIESKVVSRAIRSAQSQVEARNAEIRKNVLKYDDVLNRQREAIYGDRHHILEGDDIHLRVQSFLEAVINDVIDSHTGDGGSGDDWDFDALWAELKTLYPISITIEEVLAEAGSRGRVNREFVKREVLSDAKIAYREPRGAARRRGDARARAPRRALGDRPPLARPPVRDGLPEGRHRPARHGAARPAGRVPARGLRHVPDDDGRDPRGVRRVPLQPRGRGEPERRRRPRARGRAVERDAALHRPLRRRRRGGAQPARACSSAPRPRRRSSPRRSRRRSSAASCPRSTSSRAAARAARSAVARSVPPRSGRRHPPSAAPSVSSSPGDARRTASSAARPSAASSAVVDAPRSSGTRRAAVGRSGRRYSTARAVARQRLSMPSSRIATARVRAAPCSSTVASTTLPAGNVMRVAATSGDRPRRHLPAHRAAARGDDRALQEVAVDPLRQPAAELLEIPHAAEHLDDAGREVLDQHRRVGQRGSRASTAARSTRPCGRR